MSFVGKAIGGIGKALGIIPDAPSAPALPPPPPTTSDPATSPDLDAAAQDAARRMAGGKTSTMLTGGDGDTEDQKYTSKVLLGQ